MGQLNEERKVTLYDFTNEGFIRGARVPLPNIIKSVVDDLDGKIMTLDKVLETLSPKAKKLNGVIEIVEKYKMITFSFGDDEGYEHHYKLFHYK